MNVFSRKAVLVTVVTAGLATAACVMGQSRGGQAPAPAPPAATDNSGFPEGDSKKYVMDNCGGCHDLDTVKTAKHDLAGWKETLSHMQSYGAQITDAQVPTVAAYLAKSFPAQTTPPATAPPATPPAGTPPATPQGAAPDAKPAEDVAAEKILNTACTTCHDLGPVTRRADDKAAWESVVYGMVGNGADVKDAEIPLLVNYLVKYYGPPKEAPKAATPPAAPAAPAAPAGRGGRGARGQ